MSQDAFSSEALVSRRRALGVGLFALAGAVIGLGTTSALAQSRGGNGRSGGGSGGASSSGGSSDPGGDVILPGTPGNCPATLDCSSNGPLQTKMLVTTHREPPPPPQRRPRKPRRRRIRPIESCGKRPDGQIDRSCRNPD